MPLIQLLEGSQSSNFILIHDDKDLRGELLLSEFIKQNIRLKNDVNMLCLENNPILKDVCLTNAVNFNNYRILDPKGWWKNESGHPVDDPLKVLQLIQSKSKSDSKTVIIIDSLALFELLYPQQCYKTMHNIVNKSNPGKQQHQLICLLHNDVIYEDKRTLLMFEQLATTNVIVWEENKKSHVTIKHRKASGRIIQTVEEFYIDKNGELVTKEIKNTKENVNQEIIQTEWMNNDDITFKLDLKDEEKVARNELVLPYLKTSKETKGGEIIYDPDANDDWDEEDPDDDLNI